MTITPHQLISLVFGTLSIIAALICVLKDKDEAAFGFGCLAALALVFAS